jgi:hypothetical protein
MPPSARFLRGSYKIRMPGGIGDASGENHTDESSALGRTPSRTGRTEGSVRLILSTSRVLFDCLLHCYYATIEARPSSRSSTCVYGIVGNLCACLSRVAGAPSRPGAARRPHHPGDFPGYRSNHHLACSVWPCSSHTGRFGWLCLWRVGASVIGVARHTASWGMADGIRLGRDRSHIGGCVFGERRTVAGDAPLQHAVLALMMRHPRDKIRRLVPNL